MKRKWLEVIDYVGKGADKFSLLTQLADEEGVEAAIEEGRLRIFRRGYVEDDAEDRAAISMKLQPQQPMRVWYLSAVLGALVMVYLASLFF